MLKCPSCGHGSNHLAKKASGKGEWEEVECGACGDEFEIRAAVDKMFLEGDRWGYRRWAGCKAVETSHRVRNGEADVQPIKGKFESAYDIIAIRPWFKDGVSNLLAGAVSTKYVPQGYVMVAVGATEDFGDHAHEIRTVTLGRDPEGPELPAWQEVLFRARVGGQQNFRIAPVQAVSAMDLFVEALSPDPAYEVSSGRPGSWNCAVRKFLAEDLKALEGGSLERLDHLVEIRNALAHGRDYLNRVREPLKSEEQDWQERKHKYEAESRLTPVAKFAVGTVLRAIRNCARFVHRRSGT